MTQERTPIPDPRLKLDQLHKILILEQSKGFADDAVIGGLDEFVARWAREAYGVTAHPMVRNALKRLDLVNTRYGAKSIQERAAWVDRVLRWCVGLGDLQIPSAKPVSQPRRRRFPPKARPTVLPKPKAESNQFLGSGQGLETPLREVRGVRSDLVTALSRLGVFSVRDLLFYFPRRHIDFTITQPIALLRGGEEQTAIGFVSETKEIKLGARNRRAAEAVISDESGNVRAIWFNQPYMAKAMKNKQVALSGRVTFFKGRKVFENPEYEIFDGGETVHTARLVPVYPLTAGITSRRIRGLTKEALDAGLDLLAEFLPGLQRQRLELLGLRDAVREAHFPSSFEVNDEARRRLAFDELFLIQLGVLDRKREWKEGMPGHPLVPHPAVLDSFIESLPFPLTAAQQRVIAEVEQDLGRSNPMSRLVQGEVGSGKTVVALAAALIAVANGQQVAFMAPTELLAEQHFSTVSALLRGEATDHRVFGQLFRADLFSGDDKDIVSFDSQSMAKPIRVAFLSGGMPRKRKQEVQRLTAQGEIDIVVGTHALIQKGMVFANLALAIVDEQHRFGVMQRSELRQKGYNPHLLAMTATPIPRTLQLTVYGDLDISIIDELPPGRQDILTRRLDSSDRPRVYGFLRRQVKEGRQAFIIYPLVEESDKLDAAAATEEHARLSKEIFPDLRLGLLHGRMKPAEKDRVMRALREGELDILVSTAVVEVGIDVPNATTMLIENADRFGLSQLHQFRGRVGRGVHASYCILVTESSSLEVSERLGILESQRDGFALAEEDLRIRGPGEFFGTRQSGLPDLRMARVSDIALLELARAEAKGLFESDSGLLSPQNSKLAAEIRRFWQNRSLPIGEA